MFKPSCLLRQTPNNSKFAFKSHVTYQDIMQMITIWCFKAIIFQQIAAIKRRNRIQ